MDQGILMLHDITHLFRSMQIEILGNIRVHFSWVLSGKGADADSQLVIFLLVFFLSQFRFKAGEHTLYVCLQMANQLAESSYCL